MSFNFEQVKSIKCDFEVKRSKYRTWVDFFNLDNLKYGKVYQFNDKRNVLCWEGLCELKFDCLKVMNMIQYSYKFLMGVLDSKIVEELGLNDES